MATASKLSHSGPQIKYKVSANEEKDSLAELGIYYLDINCKNWQNYDNSAKSHIIEPIFKFKNPDYGDNEVEQMRTDNPQKNAVMKDRDGDNAEFIIQEAIEKLFQDGIQGPIIAVRNFKLILAQNEHDEVVGDLKELFPDFNLEQHQQLVQDAFGDQSRSGSIEFDFLLIGPKIGILVFETKNNPFLGKRDFENKDRYRKGIGQVKAVKALTTFWNVALEKNCQVESM